MVRFVALAALAAAAVAAPASAQEVRVSLASKTPEQIEADVAAAARAVCLRATATESFRIQAYGRCVKDTKEVTLAKVYGDAPAAASALAQR
ncbi:MAG: hypothetical protein ACK4YQ_16710 [Phenylobacterium sp.]|uniref:hypothetical protein n=1 Tax=Phenylobacterium sp. TaxID=1871053 RepID=UPI00391B3809